MSTSTSVYRKSIAASALRQGEIFSDLVQEIPEFGADDARATRFREEIHEFAIVVSQDCDLDFDWKARYCGEKESKKMTGVLFCKAELAEKQRERHEWYNSRAHDKLLNHEIERYQLLEEVDVQCDLLGRGVARLVVDFKSYFSIPPAELYRRQEGNYLNRHCFLNYPYLQHFITRFLNFQGRVALP